MTDKMTELERQRHLQTLKRQAAALLRRYGYIIADHTVNASQRTDRYVDVDVEGDRLAVTVRATRESLSRLTHALRANLNALTARTVYDGPPINDKGYSAYKLLFTFWTERGHERQHRRRSSRDPRGDRL